MDILINYEFFQLFFLLPLEKKIPQVLEVGFGLLSS
jgi:hypothetical protein